MTPSASSIQHSAQTQIITASCPSLPGTVDVVTRYLYQHGFYITEIHSFDDTDKGQFFIRIEFRPDCEGEFDRQSFTAGFGPQAEKFSMQWQLSPKSYKPKVVILVSKQDHCLNDLLYRWRIGSLAVDIQGIVSNHPDCEGLATWHNIPYYHCPITSDTKAQQEAQIWQIVEQFDTDLVILARYMQILSNDMCKKLAGWAINIHHSLLPGFKGAKPYYQAYDKGIKLVGATAHYVSDELDEGPIISQGVETVDHGHYPQDLAAKGRDMECLTLARAVQYHIEKRIFLHGKKTVVFAK
ncbi:MAG: formyltetrahydrofolate deformylase [Paraglaciecola sp.]|jgi:formyltetrahydrofolate deformylase